MATDGPYLGDIVPDTFTLDSVSKNVLESVRHVGSKFTTPQEDWRTMLFLYGERYIIADMQEMMDAKDDIPAVLETLFVQHRPTVAALVTSVWYRDLDMNAPLIDTTLQLLSTFGVSSDPQRREAVTVAVSDGKFQVTWKADITRHADRPPTLGEFEVMDGENSGRFAGLLLKTFARTSKRRSR